MSRVLFITMIILPISTLLTGCAALTKPSPANGPSPLVVSNCPELAPLLDDSFGATVLKLVEIANQYRDCRAAALAK